MFELAGNSCYRGFDYWHVTVLENLKRVTMGMERWGLLLTVVSSPIVYFLKTTRAVCPNITPIMLCAHVRDLNYAACCQFHCHVIHNNYKGLKIPNAKKAGRTAIYISVAGEQRTRTGDSGLRVHALDRSATLPCLG